MNEQKYLHNITLDELIDDINNSSNEYLFLRVLNKNDRAFFLSRLCENDYNDIYNRKKIKLSKWLNIMSKIRLTSDYIIYRKAYLGENRGKRDISKILTNFIVPLCSFDAYDIDSKNTCIFNIKKLIINRPIKPIKHILLHDKMEEINIQEYILSSWENWKYKLNNEWF